MSIVGQKRSLGIDLTGRRFGQLIVTGWVEGQRNPQKWHCICDCGNKSIVVKRCLVIGKTKSCGCLKRTRLVKHGMSNTGAFQSWLDMMNRCYKPTATRYECYGGRGIKVCDRWHEFLNFFEDMGHRADGLTLERNDVNKDYCPENCRWATRKEQQRNLRTNRLIEYKGQTKCLAEWAETIGMLPHSLHTRIKRGWSIEKAIETPVQKKQAVKPCLSD